MAKKAEKTEKKKEIARKEETEELLSALEEADSSDAESINNNESGHSAGSSDNGEDQEDQELKIHDLPAPPSVKNSKEKSKDNFEEKAKESKEQGTQPTESSIVYLGRLPHGFYEDQMRGYFSQFGEVVNLRLSRNKKTGRSKHYAFIEFTSPEIAKIVVDTMHNYLLYGRLLQCKIKPVPPGEAGVEFKKNLWKGANRKFRVVDYKLSHARRHNAERTVEQKEKLCKRLVEKEQKLKRKLQELGIDYDFPGFEESYKKVKSLTDGIEEQSK